MLAAGGTGGHVFPALALASELMRRAVDVVWVGRRDGLEADLARSHGYEFEPVPAAGFVGKGIRARLAWPGVFSAGVVRSIGLVSRWAPDAVVATGGYVAAAPLVAARLAGRPFFLLEQNRVPGRVTRFFLAGARMCFFGFPPKGTAECYFGRKVGTCGTNVMVTGNPLRPEMSTLARHDDGKTVLVLGGSGGARALTFAALDTAAALANLHFIILTGRRDFELARSMRRSSNCELVEFTDRPSELYARATIAISRAGGMVLSELVAYGIPAILVPFPYAADRHQHANAEYLESVGAAINLDQSCLSGLTSLTGELMSDTGRRHRMEQACRAVARPDAASVIAENIIWAVNQQATTKTEELGCSAG